jgi:hypothetical protein
MTNILFVGGEDTSFASISGFGVFTTNTSFRTAFARYSFNSGGNGSTATPPTVALDTGNFTPVSTLWVHGQLNITSNSFSNGSILFYIEDPTGVGRLLVMGTGTAGQVKLATRNAAGTITVIATSAAGAIPSNTAPAAFDLFINYTTTGQITLFSGGATIVDTGPGVNITTDSATTLSRVLYSSILTSGFQTNAWSECIVQDTTTLGLALQTLPPVAAGNTQSWTPNTVGNINPTSINDSNFVATTADNALSEWTVGTTLPVGSWAIEAVVQNARVSIGTTGPQHFEWLVRTSDGTDHTTGSVAPLVGSFSNFSNIWPTNPHTGAAWNPGELINAGIESLA